MFDGNTVPPTRRGYLREMIELATEDRPAIVCLQEMPVWALPQLAGWSGMEATGSSRVGRDCGGARGGDHAPPQRALSVAARRAGERDPRRPFARQHGSRRGADQRGGKRAARRDAVRVDEIGVIGNLHTSNAAPAVVLPELERARAFIDALADPGKARILAGDFNVAQPAPVGYGPGGPGIDHILVADAVADATTAWPRERRIVAGRILSDHAPVDRLIGR